MANCLTSFRIIFHRSTVKKRKADSEKASTSTAIKKKSKELLSKMVSMGK